MVKRRKFVVGLGALAAGASAAVGTGALSKTEMDRGFTGEIADDTNSGYVTLEGANGVNHNAAHVDTSETEISLDFGAIDGHGDGLNADSKNWFDRVFKITLNDVDVYSGQGPLDPENYDVWITKDVSKRAGRLGFYQADSRGNSLVGKNNSATLSGSYSRQVGVMINLLDLNLEAGNTLEDVFGADASFRIHLEENDGQ
jgi:hypothetical protein